MKINKYASFPSFRIFLNAFSLTFLLVFGKLGYAQGPCAQAEARFQQRIDSLNRVIEDLREKNTDLQGEKDNTEGDLENYRELVKTKEQKNGQLNGQIKRLEDKVTEKEQALREKEQRLEAARQSIVKLEKRWEKGESDRSRIKVLEAQVDQLKQLEGKKESLEEEKRDLVKTLQTQSQELSAKDQELTSCQTKLRQAQQARQNCESKLQETQKAFNDFKKQVSQFTNYLQQESRDIEKQVNQWYQAPELLVLVKKENPILQTERRLKPVVELTQEEGKKRAHELHKKIKRYHEFWIANQRAQQTIERDFQAAAVFQAFQDLKSLDPAGFSRGIQNQRTQRMTLLKGYCEAYKETGKLFNTFNKLDDKDLIIKFLGKLQSGDNAIDPAYRYIHEQITKRQSAPLQKGQPFRQVSTCPTLN